MDARKIISLFFCVVIVVFSLLYTFGKNKFVKVSPATSFNTPIKIGDADIFVSIADSDIERVKGLSGSPKLSDKEGMLFIFDKPGKYAFWMKDMNYPLDILWFSEDKEVIHIEKNISPNTYPQNFSSQADSKYVLELPAGFSDNHKIGLGTILYLN